MKQVSIENENYDFIKKLSTKNRRSISSELNTILEDLRTNSPDILSSPKPMYNTPVSTPTPTEYSEPKKNVILSAEDEAILKTVKAGGIYRAPKLTKEEKETQAFHEKILTQDHFDREKNLQSIYSQFVKDEDDDSVLSMLSDGVFYRLVEEDFDKNNNLTDITNHLKQLHDKYYALSSQYQEEEIPFDKKQNLYSEDIAMREQKLKNKNNECFKKIKKYCENNFMSDAFFELIEYADNYREHIEYVNEKYDNFVLKALGTPVDRLI